MSNDKTLESIEEKLTTFLDVITNKAAYYTLKPKDMFLYAKAFEAITQTILQVRLMK